MLKNILFFLLSLIYVGEFFCVLAAENPTLRVRLPMINKEIEIGGRGYTDVTPDSTIKFLIEFEYKY